MLGAHTLSFYLNPKHGTLLIPSCPFGPVSTFSVLPCALGGQPLEAASPKLPSLLLLAEFGQKELPALSLPRLRCPHWGQ